MLEKKTSKISSFQKCHSFGINWTRKMFSLKLKQSYLFITWLKIHPSHFCFIFVFFNFYMTSQCFFFPSLLDQVKSHHCKATVGVLHAAKSRSLKHWKELVWYLLSKLCKRYIELNLNHFTSISLPNCYSTTIHPSEGGWW